MTAAIFFAARSHAWFARQGRSSLPSLFQFRPCSLWLWISFVSVPYSDLRTSLIAFMLCMWSWMADLLVLGAVIKLSTCAS